MTGASSDLTELVEGISFSSNSHYATRILKHHFFKEILYYFLSKCSLKFPVPTFLPATLSVQCAFLISILLQKIYFFLIQNRRIFSIEVLSIDSGTSVHTVKLFHDSREDGHSYVHHSMQNLQMESKFFQIHLFTNQIGCEQKCLLTEILLY